MPAVIPLAVAAVSAAATVGGAALSASAANSASKRANAFQQQIANNVAPYNTAGLRALGQISDPSTVLKNFQASPDYNFRLQQGLDAVGTDKAVNGLLRSGSAIKSLNDYASGTAANEFSNWWARQMGLVDTGLKGEGVAAGVATNQSNIAQTNGANQANAFLTGANGVSSGLGSILSVLNRPTPAASSYTTGSGMPPWADAAPYSGGGG